MVKIQKKSKAPTVNNLTASMYGLNFNVKPEQPKKKTPKKKTPKKDSTNSLSRNMKNLNLTDIKQSSISRRKNLGTKKPNYSRMDVEKAKQVFRRRTLSYRNADKTLSEALNKLGLGTKKKRKKRRSKTKRN
jgi:hypothetical protein